MLAIAGTIPDLSIPLLDAPVQMKDNLLLVGDHAFAPDRGTPALLGATAQACLHLGIPQPHAFLVGDQGLGTGSRELYAHLGEILPKRNYTTLAFHYLQPDVDWHSKVLLAAQEMHPTPRLVADAGFMYAAKMSGEAPAYDLFTPDVGELAFLADENAPHPFYTRGFILQDDNRTTDLVERTYEQNNGATCLLVKGTEDIIADRSGVLSRITGPSEEAMEAMGGTGDTVTGMACALIEYGLTVPEAARTAAQANRYAGQLTAPNPGTQIGALIPHIPAALTRAMNNAPA